MSTSIQALIKSLGLAIQEAQHEINKYDLIKYSEYFTEQQVKEKDKMVLLPRCVSFPLPNSTESIDIPIITLVNHNSLGLEEVEVKMEVNTAWNKDTQQVEIDVSPIQSDVKDSDYNGVNPHNKTNINLKFKARPSAEGISKHVEVYYQEFKRNNY